MNGFSLLELLLVVAVGAVLLLAGLASYRLIDNNSKSTRTIREVVTAQVEIRRIYDKDNYNGISETNTALSSAFIGMKVDGTSILNAYGGEVHLWSEDSLTFKISFANLPPVACIDSTVAFMNNSNLVAVGVNNGTTTDIPMTSITIAAMQAACSQPANTVVWNFR